MNCNPPGSSVPSKSIYVAANGKYHSFSWMSSIPLCVHVCVYMDIYHIFVHLSVDGHVKRLNTLAIVNNTAMNTEAHVTFSGVLWI